MEGLWKLGEARKKCYNIMHNNNIIDSRKCGPATLDTQPSPNRVRVTFLDKEGDVNGRAHTALTLRWWQATMGPMHEDTCIGTWEVDKRHELIMDEARSQPRARAALSCATRG